MDFREALYNELQKSKSKLTENKKVVKESVVEEDTEYDLVPDNGRKSFYGKARVRVKDNGDEELYSYGTHVGGMRGGKPYSKGKFSTTTSAHQKSYFNQKGFDVKKVDVEESCAKRKANKKLQEEVNDEAYEIAEKISKEIEKVGILNFEDVNVMIYDLSSKSAEEIDNSDFINDVYGCLSFEGIIINYSTGDFFTQEYADEHPGVLEEGCNKKEEGKKLTESDASQDFLDDLKNLLNKHCGLNIDSMELGKSEYGDDIVTVTIGKGVKRINIEGNSNLASIRAITFELA